MAQKFLRSGFLAAALLSFACAAPAWADSPNPLSSEPVQPIQPEPPLGPIVGGSRIQPREDQVPATRERLANDERLKELYEGVMRDSDPSTYRRNREPVAR